MNRFRNDDGVALVTVMGAVAVIGTLIMTALNLAGTSLKSGSDHTRFESALGVAEAGIDRTLALISTAYNSAPSVNYVTTGTCAVPAPTAAEVADDLAERRWAAARLAALPAACTTPTPTGDFVAVRPQGRQAVYSMSWVPSRTSPNAKRRLIKAEYLFAPYKPGNAILTNGDIDLSGSVTVNALDPTVPANIHTNGDVSDYNNSLDVSGSVSASGTLPGACPNDVEGGCLAAQPKQTIPVLNPRSIYNAQATITTGWYDLCSASGVGEVRLPSAAGPCQGTLQYQLGVGGNPIDFQGWTYSVQGSGVPLWTLASGSSSYPGAYYVYGGDAQIGGNGNSKDDRFITVMAEALPTGGAAASCGKFGGNIAWKLFSLRPYLSGTILAAQGSLTGGAGADAGPGLFTAGDRIDLKTSSSKVQGAMVAGNICAAAGENTIQGVTVSYDETVEAAVNDVIRTSLWIEYPSS